MDQNKEKIRYILQYNFVKGDKASQACVKICGVCGEGAVSQLAARKWSARFRSGSFDVKNEPRSSRPISKKSDEILEKIEQDRHISNHGIAHELNIHHRTICKRLGSKRDSTFGCLIN